MLFDWTLQCVLEVSAWFALSQTGGDGKTEYLSGYLLGAMRGFNRTSSFDLS
jgi:hypothetical protein